MTRLAPTLAILALLSTAAHGQDQPPTVHDLVAKALASSKPEERSALVEAIVAARPDPEAVARELAAGRTYAADAPTGWMEKTILAKDGKERPYLLFVPPKHDPARRFRMVIEMHGGVSRPQTLTHAELAEMKESWGEQAEKDGWILAFPAGQTGATWWDPVGSGMVLSILRETKRTYDVDEDAVFATGFSDGGSGSWFLAAAHPTPFAGFIPLNGHPSVAGAGGVPVYLRNFLNRPVYAINTDQDSLYPSAALKPIFDAMKALGAPLVWHEVTGFGHDPSYIPQERPAILKWMDGVRRETDPKVVTWEGIDGAPSRVGWLRVAKVTGGSGVAPFAYVNPVLTDTRVRIGVAVDREFAGPGVRLTGVSAGSPAKDMDLRGGDVIVAIDGAEVADFAGLRRALAKKTFGDEIAVRAKRGEETIERKGRIPPAKSEPAFERDKPHGSLRAEAKGNRIEVTCLGIGSFDLFLSPRLVDLGKPVEVVVNGRAAFSGVVKPDLRFLLEQALADEDRSLVYRARLTVEVPAASPPR